VFLVRYELGGGGGESRIYICYVQESRSPLWSSGQSSWIQNGDVLPVR
jgi:hypothetical protein